MSLMWGIYVFVLFQKIWDDFDRYFDVIEVFAIEEDLRFFEYQNYGFEVENLDDFLRNHHFYDILDQVWII